MLGHHGHSCSQRSSPAKQRMDRSQSEEGRSAVGGKLAYVYLPDTAAGGFTNFNRYYFAQLDKQGAVIDERFNSGGQVADYIIAAMQRKLEGY
jgi:hypothetical protein